MQISNLSTKNFFFLTHSLVQLLLGSFSVTLLLTLSLLLLSWFVNVLPLYRSKNLTLLGTTYHKSTIIFITLNVYEPLIMCVIFSAQLVIIVIKEHNDEGKLFICYFAVCPPSQMKKICKLI